MATTDISLFAYESAEEKKEKSPNALRTISEASEILDVPQHVLRFWETKFNQIRPLKRNGGRRFYRPQDIEVLQQIKHLLYSQGYTIKGAKKAVDDFVRARAERHISGSEWIESVPPASVNDNYATPTAMLLEAAEPTDVLSDIAKALQEPLAQTSGPSRESLQAMRKELQQLRDSLCLMLTPTQATA